VFLVCSVGLASLTSLAMRQFVYYG